jgi:serine/threonine-protein kinase HipA
MKGAIRTRQLEIFIEQTHVGALMESEDVWTLEYAPEWVAREDSFDISPALPRSQLRHVDGSSLRPVQWFFDNLLPEEELRTLVAKDAGIRDKDDAFALLEYLGAESAGSLTLLPTGEAPSQERALRQLPFSELSRRIQALPSHSLTREAPKRMSIAGAQHKMLAVLKDGEIFEPVGATPSTHILKPDHPQRQTYPDSTYLEYLTMKMADAAGLNVPEVQLLHVPEPVYAIQRFDREVVRKDGSRVNDMLTPAVRRRHVIDACQLLNRSRIFKHSGASVEALREAIEITGDVLTLPQRIFRWLVFNLLVANDDCHLKNLSFLVQPNSITLAPHYDLLATGVYHTKAIADADGQWPNVNLAVRLAPNITRFNEVTPDAVIHAAMNLGVPASVASRVIKEVVSNTFRYFDSIYVEHYPDEVGLLTKSESPAVSIPSGIESTHAFCDEQMALHRRILRVLRHIILPDMAARVAG